MNINTDLIRNKKFKRAISDELLKESQEYTVLAVLRYLFPGKYEQMKHADKPDLQDKNNSIAIEVTVAVQESDMKANRAFAKIDKTTSESQEIATTKITECGYEINKTNEIMSIVKGGTSDSEKHGLHKAILNKCKKANNYKMDFHSSGLAVLLSEIPTSDTENHIIDWLKEIHSEIESSFDFIYVISHRFCIMYDIKNDIIGRKCLRSTENRMLRTIARMTAEGEITLESDEWKCTINHSNNINV